MLNRTAALHNLGCKVNAYETEVMQQMLSDAGYTIVPFTEKADVYIINTCSVTNMADKKSRQMISRARKNNPGAVVAAAGCYVQAAGEKLLEELSVDLNNASPVRLEKNQIEEVPDGVINYPFELPDGFINVNGTFAYFSLLYKAFTEDADFSRKLAQLS